MKGLSVLILIALLPFRNSISGQGAGPEAKKIRFEELPPAVQEAVRKDFPKAVSEQVWAAPLWVYYADWQAGPLNRGDWPDTAGQPEVYAFELSKGRSRLEAVYNKEGGQLQVKEVLRDSRLPRQVPAYIVRHYKGYAILTGKIKRILSPGDFQHYYEVWITQGKIRKRLFFDGEGAFIWEQQ
jgi:hypothetical protein